MSQPHMSAGVGTRFGVVEPTFPSGEVVIHTESLQLTVPVLAMAASPFADDRVAPGSLKTRRELSTPKSPLPELSDSILYEDPANPDQKYYLPRYRLAEEVVSGKTQYRIALKKRAAKWALSVGLEKFPAPEIQLDARTAKELPHELRVVL